MKTIHDALENVEECTEGVEITLTDSRTGAVVFSRNCEAECLLTTILENEIPFYLN